MRSTVLNSLLALCAFLGASTAAMAGSGPKYVANTDYAAKLSVHGTIHCNEKCSPQEPAVLTLVDTGLDDSAAKAPRPFHTSNVDIDSNLAVDVEYFWGRNEALDEKRRASTFTVEVVRKGCEKFTRVLDLGALAKKEGVLDVALGEITLKCG